MTEQAQPNDGEPGNAPRLSRRRLLAAGGATALGALGAAVWLERPRTARHPAATSVSHSGAGLPAAGRPLRLAGSRPEPSRPAATDMLPGIDHFVILMLENHSYDNLFGMLGRGPGQTPRGDGFTLGADGRPTATNPYGDGRIQHAFHMPTTCQLPGTPSQEWTAGHVAYNGGRNDGFVRAPIGYGSSVPVGGVAMGYWTGEDLPFTYSLATEFPIGDRWFCSVLGQTDPNRRYLIAGTSAGLTDDIGNGLSALQLPFPANGTIFNTLDGYGISWANYVESFPSGATPLLYPNDDLLTEEGHYHPFSQFYRDAAAGVLRSVSLLDPDYNTQSQENPQNIVVGEALLARVVNTVGSSPQWPSTVLIVMYDEHGGYYDHVPPPAAPRPDDIAPLLRPGQSAYEGFARYGFRVPSVVVGPYAKGQYVSHVAYDHTSVLAMIERKWNLPALTLRDANANDLTDFIDLKALAQKRPTFPTVPRLAPPGDTTAALACSTRGPGTIPPPGSVTGG